MPDAPRAAALVCAASTLGVVVPPSLVLILLGDAMMRAHTEAVNATHASMRIVNTQDVFVGALVPAAIVFVLTGRRRVADRSRSTARSAQDAAAYRASEWRHRARYVAFIVAIARQASRSAYLFAVEAAAAGGVALFTFGAGDARA